MTNEITIRITGEAGQGTQTIGDALCRVYKAAGFHILCIQDFMSRIRGGNNFTQIRVSNHQVLSPRSRPDIIVCLDKASVDLHKRDLAIDGVIVSDKAASSSELLEDPCYIDIAFGEIADRIAGNKIFSNSIACGFVAGITGTDFASVSEGIKEIFGAKNEDIIKANLNCARAGFELGMENPRREFFTLEKAGRWKPMLLDGTSAIALGAVNAGCKFYSAYPMSPSTGIMDSIAEAAAQNNILVEQAEDEIAAVNMAIGASFAGVRSMVSTSGGGFCLMTEGVSLSGMTETPLVIVDAQRPGPATGFPTRTEQADLDFVISAGHGEFARVVYAPGSPQQAYELTVRAFDISDKYQIPAVILTDQYLQDSICTIEPIDLSKRNKHRYVISKEESPAVNSYKRYCFCDSGISKRAVPSWINDVVYADSDEHTEEGHITEDSAVRKQMVQKRLHKKLHGLLKEIEKPSEYNVDNAEVILFGFGSTLGILREATYALEKRKVGYVHLSQVWPFPSQDMLRLLSDARMIISIENNAQGQLAKLLRRETGIKVSKSILKYDGRPFDLDSVIDIIKPEL